MYPDIPTLWQGWCILLERGAQHGVHLMEKTFRDKTPRMPPFRSSKPTPPKNKKKINKAQNLARWYSKLQDLVLLLVLLTFFFSFLPLFSWRSKYFENGRSHQYPGPDQGGGNDPPPFGLNLRITYSKSILVLWRARKQNSLKLHQLGRLKWMGMGELLLIRSSG